VRAPIHLGSLLAFRSGGAGTGWLPFGLLAAAALALVLASDVRLRLAVQAVFMSVFGFTAILVLQWVTPSGAHPVPESLLVFGAFGLAVATGIGVGAFVAEMRSFLFGFRQIAAIVALLGLLVPTGGLLTDMRDGRFAAPRDDWSGRISWMSDLAARDGRFRVLWVGDARAMPLPASPMGDERAIALSADGGGDARDLLPAAGSATALLRSAVDLAVGGRTARLGHLLAPAGVRFVAVVDRVTPDAAAARPRADIADGIAGQLDLTVYQTESGLTLYQNEAWIPMESVAPPGTAVPAGGRDPIGAALMVHVGAAPARGRVGAGATMLLAEPYSSRWTVRGAPGAEHVRAFDWAYGWRVPVSVTHAQFHYAEPMVSRVAHAVEALAWIVVLILLVRTGSTRRRPRRRRDRRRATASAGAAETNGEDIPEPQGQP
jgi:hypothetical protein